MKLSIESGLIILILFHSFSNTAILVRFKFNQEFIASTLCINKDIEKTLCFGHCQLKKALEENQENNRHIPIPNGLKDINFIFTPNTLAIIISNTEFHKPELSCFQKSERSSNWILNLFKPPENIRFIKYLNLFHSFKTKF